MRQMGLNTLAVSLGSKCALLVHQNPLKPCAVGGFHPRFQQVTQAVLVLVALRRGIGFLSGDFLIDLSPLLVQDVDVRRKPGLGVASGKLGFLWRSS